MLNDSWWSVSLYLWNLTVKLLEGTCDSFCGKCCVCIDKCVFIIVKIKCVNSGRICEKVNFTIKLYTFYNTWQTFIKTHTNIINSDMFDRTGPQRDLKISGFTDPTNKIIKTLREKITNIKYQNL